MAKVSLDIDSWAASTGRRKRPCSTCARYPKHAALARDYLAKGIKKMDRGYEWPSLQQLHDEIMAPSGYDLCFSSLRGHLLRCESKLYAKFRASERG